jgi:alkylation response protein AidB-like acyl-CoA dehydrogenase
MSMDPEMVAMLRDNAKRYAADNYSFQQRRSVLHNPTGHGIQAWRDYAELGWLALRMPEDCGGMSADAAAVGAVMEVVGSHLLMEPILASAIVCTGLVLKQATPQQQANLLPRMADGSLKLAFASTDDPAPGAACELRGGTLTGSKIGVLHGDIADQFIICACNVDAGGVPVLCLTEAAQISRESFRLVDGRGAANLRFESAVAERLGPERGASAAAVISEVCDEATVALCAEALGVVRRLVASTCEYLKVRKQFGKPIGANQALQHRAVDMFLLQQEIAALTQAAQGALERPAAGRARIVSGARAYVITAARHIANEAVQMHGGLGITDELDISHYFRRLMVNAALFGGRDQHFSRFTEETLSSL